MKIAFAALTPEVKNPNALGYRGDLEKTVGLMKELGYDGIELMVKNPLEFNQEAVEGIIKRSGLEVPQVCTGEVFGEDEVVVCPSGSCVNMVRNRYPELLEDEPRWLDRARNLAPRVYELTEFLVGVLKVEDVGAAFSGKVAYHESCSLLNGLGVSEQPKKLLRAVRGAELVPMRDADVCCGFGGEFSSRYPEISEALVAAKAARFLESGADVLVLCEPGCLTNINGYLSRHHPDRKALHMAEFLARNLAS